MLSLAAFVTGEPLPSAWSLRLIGLMGFQAVVVSFASYLLWFWLVRHYPATLLSSFTFGAPLFGVMAGGLLLGEPITARLLLALAGLALGVLMVNRRAPQAEGSA